MAGAGGRHQRAERIDDEHRHRCHRGQRSHRPRRHIAMQLWRHIAVQHATYTAEETGLRRVGAALHILADPFSCYSWERFTIRSEDTANRRASQPAGGVVALTMASRQTVALDNDQHAQEDGARFC